MKRKMNRTISVILCIAGLGFFARANTTSYNTDASRTVTVAAGTATNVISDDMGNMSKPYFETTSYFDIDGDGINEKVIKRISNDTSEALSYYIYKNNLLIWTRENLYKGSVTIQKNTLIESTPIYAAGESNSSPSKVGQTTYNYDSKNNTFINAGFKEYSLNNSTPNIIEDASSAYYNPSYDKIKTILDEVADEKGIPRVILEAIAWQESKGADPDNGGITNWRQFKNGAPLIGYDGLGIGVMQVSDYALSDTSPATVEYVNRLKYDIEFNIREGANILLTKWVRAFSTGSDKTPKVGNMATNYLEHWYYTIWAYNSYATTLHPNTNNPAYNHDSAYQTLVINFVNGKFATPMTDLYLYDNTLFTIGVVPTTDIPELNSDSLHASVLKTKSIGTTYIADNRYPVVLRDSNMNSLGTYSKGTAMEILSGPIYVNGYSRYNVQIGDLTGSVADMYLKPAGEFNYDTIVDIYDLVILSKKLNTAVDSTNAQDIRKYDINNNGVIDIQDLALVSVNYNCFTVK